MTFAEFKDSVSGMLDEIPQRFLDGLQGVHVFEHTKTDPQHPELLRLGEYLDPGPDQSFAAHHGLGRHIALYYGSFWQLAQGQAWFDWEEETWETLIHELQHHVESKAGDRSLIEWDLEQLEQHKRQQHNQHAKNERSTP